MYACMYDIYSLVYTLCYIKCVALITTTYTFEAEAWNAQTDQAAMDLIITSAHLKKKNSFLKFAISFHLSYIYSQTLVTKPDITWPLCKMRQFNL